MAEALVRNESPVEYFRGLVEAAIQRQRVAAREVTAFYLVNLLTGFVRVEGSGTGGEPALGIRYVKALSAAGVAQRDELRHVGDLSLFTAGFLTDSLSRSLVDVDYYIHIGECAYASLARNPGVRTDVFDELSEKFPAFVEVLGDVSDHTTMAASTDLLRLYEGWLRTGSRRTGELLVSRGVVPNASVRRHRVQ